MNKTLKSVLAFFLLGLIALPAFASNNNSPLVMTTQYPILEPVVKNTTFANPTYAQMLSPSGASITGVMISSGSQPEWVGIFDSPPISPQSPIAYDVPTEAIFYADITPYTTVRYDFADHPIRSKSGVYVVLFNGQLSSAATDASLGSVLVYGEQSK